MSSPRLHNVAGFALLVAGAAACPSASTAQVEIGPALGTYLPRGAWTQQSDNGTVQRRPRAAHMLGARITAWVSGRLAAEGMLAFSPSPVAVSSNGRTTDVAGAVLLASVRALVNVTSLPDGHPDDPTTWHLMLGAGAGLVHRGGPAWENTSGVTAPALVLTAAARTRITASLSWRVSLEDFISWAQFDRGLPSQTRARVHHDLVASLAVALRVTGP